MSAHHAGRSEQRGGRSLERKYLIHTSVESLDAENIYNSNVTTDSQGYATVPPYFDAENTEPRYVGELARPRRSCLNQTQTLLGLVGGTAA